MLQVHKDFENSVEWRAVKKGLSPDWEARLQDIELRIDLSHRSVPRPVGQPLAVVMKWQRIQVNGPCTIRTGHTKVDLNPDVQKGTTYRF